LKPTVTIVDYGSGNLLSVQRALEHCGATAILSDDPAVIASAERLVLPGVGAFAEGMQGLRDRGLVDPIQRFATSGRPLLGICLGMQMLATTSSEFGNHEGLNLIEGNVVPIFSQSTTGQPLKIPNIAWCELKPTSQGELAGSPLDGLPDDAAVYLVHSFHVVPRQSAHLLATYDHGGQLVTAAIRSRQVVGCQFHPEKSGKIGLQILNSFLKM